MTHATVPRDADKEARIFASATHIFAAVGYQNAKTDAIATHAQVSKGLLFHYFGSKANLYLETVRHTYAKLTSTADRSVWQNADNLTVMVTRALRYKIQMQLDYPDEFALAMSAYANTQTLPVKMRQELADIWNDELDANVPSLITPVLERMQLRPGIEMTQIQKMVTGISMLIGEEAKAMIQKNPHITIAEFDPVVDEAVQYMDILQHGFLAN